MSKISNFLFIRIIFNILISAVQRKKTFNFESWMIAKSIFDRRVNRVAIKYINSKSLDVNSKKKMLLTLAIFLRLSFKVRTFVFCKLIPFRTSKTISLLVALVCVHFFAYTKVFASFYNLRKSYSFDFDSNSKKIIVVIGFPKHSFNYVNQGKSLVGSSFAEYLKANSNLEKDFDTILLSIDEYTRKSKVLESDASERQHDIFNALRRYQIRKSSSFISFVINFYYALSMFFKEYLSLSALQLFEFSSRVNLIPYNRLFLKLKYQIDSIYVLPFSKFEYLNFDSEYLGKLKTFYYSENMLIHPLMNDFSDSDNVNPGFLDGNLSSLGNFGSLVGFTEIACRLKKVGTLVFCKSHLLDDATPEFPCMLGYEEPLTFLKRDGSFVLSIFDVPPEDEYSQLKRSLIGDMTANLEFIDSFLSDFININISSDFVILYKPKYSLGNYSNEYKKVINSLIDKFYDKFVLLDPYVRFEDLMNITDLAISFPYTSTYKFAKYSGVNSFFYIPDAYIKDFIFYGKRNDCLYGIESVNSYISSLGRGDK